MKATFSKQYKTFQVLFTIFALMPFSTNKIIRYIHNFHFIVQILQVFLVFSGASVIRTGGESSLRIILAYTFSYGICLTHLVVSLDAFFTRRKQFKLLNSFELVDKLFARKLNYRLDYLKEKRSLWRVFVAFMAAFSTLSVYNSYKRLYTAGTDFKIWYFHLYPTYHLRMRSFQILFYAILLNNRLKILNEKLNEFVADDYFRQPIDLDAGKETEIEFIFSYSNDYTSYIKHQRLSVIKHLYGKLSDINDLINDTLGWSLLILLTFHFINFVNGVYRIFVSLNSEVIEFTALFQIFIVFSPALLYTLPVLYFCDGCKKTVRISKTFNEKVTSKLCP